MEKDKNILVAYNNNCKLLNMPATVTEFENVVYSKFFIDRSVSILIQCFNENWQEYIDIHKDEDIVPGKKYRVVLHTPKVLYIENEVPDCSYSDTSSVTNASSFMFNNTGTCESAEQDHFAPSATPQSSFSLDNFTIPSKDFSSRLRQALQDQVPLPRVLRSEFIHCICSSVVRNEKYPTSIMMTDLARAIISEYPYLRESIGSGYGGWRQALRDKFKNLRRFDESEEVQQKKKIKITNITTSKREQSKEQEQLKKQLMGNNNEQTIVQLRESFDIRRDEIVNHLMKVDALKVKYPNLFTKQNLLDEFFRITGKSDIFQCIKSFLEKYSKELNKLLLARKNLPSWVESLKCMQGESDTEIAKEEFVLISLPVHFNEDQLLLTYPATTSSDDILNAGYSSPHVGIIGIETKQAKYYVMAESQIILNCNSLLEAVVILVASYFVLNCEYPKHCFKTMMFMEKVIFDIQLEKKKLPSKVVNFAQKLKNSV